MCGLRDLGICCDAVRPPCVCSGSRIMQNCFSSECAWWGTVVMHCYLPESTVGPAEFQIVFWMIWFELCRFVLSCHQWHPHDSKHIWSMLWIIWKMLVWGYIVAQLCCLPACPVVPAEFQTVFWVISFELGGFECSYDVPHSCWHHFPFFLSVQLQVSRLMDL